MDIVKSMGAMMGIIAAIVSCIVVFITPWIYHIVWCIQMAAETGSAIALLIVGVVLPPIGWLHGVCLILGYTWI